MRFNLPTALTWMRIVMIPLFVGVYYFPSTWLALPQQNLVATIIFVVGALTDLLDGYLARKLNQVSAFGAFLDPVADKLMVAAALIVLVHLTRLNEVIAVIIIGREITISDSDAAIPRRDWTIPAAVVGHMAHPARGGAHLVVHVLLPQDGHAYGAKTWLIARVEHRYNLHPPAGVAQLVERNLAKVEVASSRLVSRSKLQREGA
jgi:CDP-diacylglycerol--glycerol-3-phosphate 3-phosphatidyltransferase